MKKGEEVNATEGKPNLILNPFIEKNVSPEDLRYSKEYYSEELRKCRELLKEDISTIVDVSAMLNEAKTREKKLFNDFQQIREQIQKLEKEFDDAMKKRKKHEDQIDELHSIIEKLDEVDN